ncbi:MAG: Hsp20/alpha crystallin family protein [Terriglobia bacterium]|nr:Hsp20/alpha crystallin family protein [Terriglobia bacterium]
MIRTFWMNSVDPFTDLARLEQWMDYTIEQALKAVGPISTGNSSFIPPVDVWEDADRLLVKVEVPGMSENDFKLTLQNNVLTISGERRLPEGVKAEAFTHVERPYGSFTRSVTLPNTVDPSTISASYSNGVLEIALSKRAEAKPRQIPVSVAKPKSLVGSVANS